MLPPPELRTAWSGFEDAWHGVAQAGDDLAAWADFLLHCDHLGRAADRHGCGHVSDALTPVVAALDVLPVPDGEPADRLQGALAALRQAVRQPLQPPPTPWPLAARRRGLPQLVVWSGDEALVHEALLHMEHYGYGCRLVPDGRQAVATAVAQRAVAVLVELHGAVDDAAHAVIEALRRHGIAWCAIARQAGYALRLDAVRHGARFVFTAPLAMDALAHVLDPLAYPASETPFKVLSLDDSRTALAAVQQALDPYPDIRLGILSQPHKVLDVLHHFAPDVLLLDLHISDCTGLEVAQIVRQHRAFESIPIVFLTGETEKAAQMEAMQHGADDLLVKPVAPRELYNAIAQRARRYRSLRRLMEEDSLTGLYNHGKTKSLLQGALLQAERLQLPLCYALLDIDHFKKVNDTYGHAVGDKVIMTLARHLRQRVRGGDVVGRYGGEEFALVLLDCPIEQARELVDAVRESFCGIYHAYDAGLFCASLSCGVADYRPGRGMPALMAAADAALYDAKRAGRNQVHCAA